MKIKIICPPIIDCSWLMRSPQSDIWILFSILKNSKYSDNVQMKDYRFFFYDLFYENILKEVSFRKEQFFDHKSIISLVNWDLNENNYFYQKAKSLYDSIKIEFEDSDYLILPISVFEQFSIEYLLSSLLFWYFFKKENKNSKIIFFWTYRSIYIDEIMDKFDFVDSIIKKWDKHSVLEYIDLDYRNLLWEEILNFCYRLNWYIISWEERDIDINTDLIPDYSGFDLLVHKQEENKLVLSYELWQWCRNNCFYCYNLHKWWKYFVKDIDKIVKEIKLLSTKYETNLFHFDDNEINYSNTFLSDLSNKIIKEKLIFYWTALIIPRDLEYELLLNLYNSWCRQLRFWIESWSPRILDIIWKKTNINWIEKILAFCKRIWISTYASFIVDLPQETNNDIKLTLKFLYKNRDLLDNVCICAYNSHLWTFDKNYFNFLLWKWDYNYDRTKRFSRKKLFLRKFCDKLGLLDIDVIQFMKHKLWKN